MINKLPLVSICIPTYNGAAYIMKCIESAIGQTYDKIELIINDDGSSDDTILIINEFIKKDNRIKFTKNSSNLGLVENWNKTLDLASGEYIKWLFQDDYLEKNAIEEFVNAASNGYDFIISKRCFELPLSISKMDQHYYEHQVKKLENEFDLNEKNHYFSPKQIADLSTKYIALNFIAEPSLIFFKKTLIEKVGNYDKLFHQICDLEYNLRLTSIAGVFVINKSLCHFVIHSNSATNNNINDKYFQLRFIEQAYYAYKIVNNLVFSSFRKHLSSKQKLILTIYYKYRLFEANNFLKKNPNISSLNEFNKNYPFLKTQVLDKIFFKPLFKMINIIKPNK